MYQGLANAQALYRGFKDMGVETKFVVYKGHDHSMFKPKTRLAVMWHNWEWFARHLWGEKVEMPVNNGE